MEFFLVIQAFGSKKTALTLLVYQWHSVEYVKNTGIFFEVFSSIFVVCSKPRWFNTTIQSNEEFTDFNVQYLRSFFPNKKNCPLNLKIIQLLFRFFRKFQFNLRTDLGQSPTYLWHKPNLGQLLDVFVLFVSSYYKICVQQRMCACKSNFE